MKRWIILLIALVATGYYLYTNPTISSKITAFSGIGVTSIGDITTNSQKYENKAVTISGTLSLSEEYLADDQGYSIEIRNCKESGRTLYSWEKYKATGIITFEEKCSCENRRYVIFNDTKFIRVNSSWLAPTTKEEEIEFQEKGWGYHPDVLISKQSCLIESIKIMRDFFGYSNGEPVFLDEMEEYKCKSNSIEKEYYFKCTEPMVKV